MLNRLFIQARGQGLVEYSLIIVLVVLAVFGVLVLFGPQLASAFRDINGNL